MFEALDAALDVVLGWLADLSADPATAIRVAALALLLVAGLAVAAEADPFVQQATLVGTGASGTPHQGTSVALSGDGNTAIVGGNSDNSDTGAAWVFTRIGSSWAQQGPKLVGTGASGPAGQGTSVALSADGNTALVGGPSDNGTVGAVWVFTRSGSTWSQQGSKLVGTGNVGGSYQGSGVALSDDGNTALVGGPIDNGKAPVAPGAVWVFTRSGSTWSQQGTKLVGTGGDSGSQQGSSVALSSDGNTALEAGWRDNSFTGAGWVFTRSGSTWSQQGSKLVGTGAVGGADQGFSVGLSGDGNTALLGGPGDDSNTGAGWVFTRSGSTWSQQGSKLVGTGAVGAAQQGHSGALSGDGNIALLGGYFDDSGAGATWAFTRSGSAWSQNGPKLIGTGAVGAAAQGISAALSRDGSTALVGGPQNAGGNPGAAWVFEMPPTTSGGGSTGGVAGALPLPTAFVRPTISSLSQTHPIFRVGRRSTPLLGRTTRTFPRGDTFSFRLNQPAVVAVRIQRKLPGRRVGRVCKAPTRALRFRPRCTRLVTKATLRRTARVGRNKIAFSGRIRGHALHAGRYRAAFAAANTAGTSALRALSFRIVAG